MNVKRWWHEKSGRSKVLTALATILILDIGLCFATPEIVPPLWSLLGVRNEGNDDLGLMVLQAIFCAALFVAIALVGILWTSDARSGSRKRKL